MQRRCTVTKRKIKPPLPPAITSVRPQHSGPPTAQDIRDIMQDGQLRGIWEACVRAGIGAETYRRWKALYDSGPGWEDRIPSRWRRATTPRKEEPGSVAVDPHFMARCIVDTNLVGITAAETKNGVSAATIKRYKIKYLEGKDPDLIEAVQLYRSAIERDYRDELLARAMRMSERAETLASRKEARTSDAIKGFTAFTERLYIDRTTDAVLGESAPAPQAPPQRIAAPVQVAITSTSQVPSTSTSTKAEPDADE